MDNPISTTVNRREFGQATSSAVALSSTNPFGLGLSLLATDGPISANNAADYVRKYVIGDRGVENSRKFYTLSNGEPNLGFFLMQRFLLQLQKLDHISFEDVVKEMAEQLKLTKTPSMQELDQETKLIKKMSQELQESFQVETQKIQESHRRRIELLSQLGLTEPKLLISMSDELQEDVACPIIKIPEKNLQTSPDRAQRLLKDLALPTTVAYLQTRRSQPNPIPKPDLINSAAQVL